MIHPLTLQSLCFNLFSIRGLMMLSGINSPESIHWEITLPTSGLNLISFLRRARADTWTRPKVLATAIACVFLPEPGGPTMMILGGLLGAFSLNLIDSILLRPGMTSLYDLSATSCSKINWLNASLTPFKFNSCSFKQFAASSSRSGPNNCWLIPRRLFFNLEIDAVCLHLSKINLSGMMPIFWRANAYALVLGNPWMIQLWPLASNALICLDTISITIASSTIFEIKLITHEYRVILTEVICFLCFTDFLAELSFLGYLFFEKASSLNGLPSILFGDCFGAFRFESAWWAHEEDSSNYW